MLRGHEEYCPVHGERFCEEAEIECPWVLRSLGEEVDLRVCPMTPQLDVLKGVLRQEGVVRED